MTKVFFEVWTRGYAKDKLNELSQGATEEFHPHVTLVRPGVVKTSLEDIQKAVVNNLKGIGPVPFTFEGSGVFDDKFYHVPVKNAHGLIALSGLLEDAVKKHVKLEDKPEEETHLHASVIPPKPDFTCPRIDQYALWVTALAKGHFQNGKAEPHKSYVVAFSYDLVNGRVLSRTQSKSKMQWLNTVHDFCEKYDIMPTRNGYVRLSNPFCSRKI
jgi:hypothetical protein